MRQGLSERPPSPLPAVPTGHEWRFCLQLTTHESSLSSGAEVFDGLRVCFWSDCWIAHEVGWLCLFSKGRISSPQDTTAVSRSSVSGFARLTHWESPWVTSNPEIVGRRPEGLRYGLEKMGMATPWGATSIPERAGAWRHFPQDPVYLPPGCVVRYPEFKVIWAKNNRDCGKQTPISDHCGASLLLLDRVFQKGLLCPMFTHNSLLVTRHFSCGQGPHQLRGFFCHAAPDSPYRYGCLLCFC